MKKFKKLFIIANIFVLAIFNLFMQTSVTFANEEDAGRLVKKDETYYVASFHSQSSDNHFANLNFEFDFKMILDYKLEEKTTKNITNHTITLEKADFIKRGDGYYRTNRPYTLYPLEKENYIHRGVVIKVVLLANETNQDRYLGYSSNSFTTDRYNGSDLKTEVIRNVVRVLNRNIEKVVIDYDGEVKSEDKNKIIANIKKANLNMNGNAIYSIKGEYVEISNIGREDSLRILIDDCLKRVKHTDSMTDLSKDDISNLEITVQTLQERITVLEENIISKDNLNAELQTKLERVETEKANLQEELVNVQRLLEEKIGNIADLRLEIVELENRITNLEKEVSNLQKEKENLTNENTDLQNENAELERQMAEKDEFIRIKEAKIEELIIEINNLNTQKESLFREKTTLETEKDQLQQSNDALSRELLEKDKLIQEKEDKIRELENRISTLEIEKELLEQDKNNLEEEKANLQNQNALLNNQLIDKDKIIQSKENKITELEEEINKLNEKASCCVNYDEIAAIGRTIDKLREDIAKLKDEVKRIKIELPKDIKIGQWYPETIIKYPTKRQYKNNEYIDLTGMKIRFTKYVKENDEYKVINEEVDYEIFKNETHGWEFKLKTPKAIYNKETSGKMQIKFSFVLKNKEKSME